MNGDYYRAGRAVLGARRVSAAGDLPVGLPSASRLHQGLDKSALQGRLGAVAATVIDGETASRCAKKGAPASDTEKSALPESCWFTFVLGPFLARGALAPPVTCRSACLQPRPASTKASISRRCKVNLGAVAATVMDGETASRCAKKGAPASDTEKSALPQRAAGLRSSSGRSWRAARSARDLPGGLPSASRLHQGLDKSVIALYNPVSRARPWQFGAAIERLRRHLPPSTPVVLGRAVGRADECVSVVTLAAADAADTDMATLVIVGSRETRVIARSGRSPPCDELRQAQAASRLSHRTAFVGLPSRPRRHGRARP